MYGVYSQIHFCSKIKNAVSDPARRRMVSASEDRRSSDSGEKSLDGLQNLLGASNTRDVRACFGRGLCEVEVLLLALEHLGVVVLQLDQLLLVLPGVAEDEENRGIACGGGGPGEKFGELIKLRAHKLCNSKLDRILGGVRHLR
jgi:hypothetical protein